MSSLDLSRARIGLFCACLELQSNVKVGLPYWPSGLRNISSRLGITPEESPTKY